MEEFKRTLPSDFCRACYKGDLENVKLLIKNNGGKINYRDFHFGQGFCLALRKKQYELVEWLLENIFPTLDPEYITTDKVVTLESILRSKEFLPPMVIVIGRACLIKDDEDMHLLSKYISTKSIHKLLKRNARYGKFKEEDFEQDDDIYVTKDIGNTLKELELEFLLPCFPDQYHFSIETIEQVTHDYDRNWPEYIHKEPFMRCHIIEMMCYDFLRDHIIRERVDLEDYPKCNDCFKRRAIFFSCGNWMCGKCHKKEHESDEKFRCSYCKVEMCSCRIKTMSGKFILCEFCDTEGVYFSGKRRLLTFKKSK